MQCRCRCIHIVTRSKLRLGELSQLLIALDYRITQSASVTSETGMYASCSRITIVDCISDIALLASLHDRFPDVSGVLALIGDRPGIRASLYSLGAFDYIAFPLVEDEVRVRVASCEICNQDHRNNQISVIAPCGECTPKVRCGEYTLTNKTIGTTSKENAEKELVENVCRYLMANIDSTQTLNQMARRNGTNRNALAGAFKKYLGMGVFAWLRRQRIRAAAELLEQSDMGVQQICDKVGYRDAANFSTSFKGLLGQSPLQYRRKVRNQKK